MLHTHISSKKAYTKRRLKTFLTHKRRSIRIKICSPCVSVNLWKTRSEHRIYDRKGARFGISKDPCYKFTIGKFIFSRCGSRDRSDEQSSDKCLSCVLQELVARVSSLLSPLTTREMISGHANLIIVRRFVRRDGKERRVESVSRFCFTPIKWDFSLSLPLSYNWPHKRSIIGSTWIMFIKYSISDKLRKLFFILKKRKVPIGI